MTNPDEQYAIVENLPGPPPEGQIHPERTPIGPFASRQEAEGYAEDRCREYGGGSWSVAKMIKP